MNARFLGLPLFFWAAACLALAALWVFIWPSDRAAARASGWRYVGLRWGHALCWLLLGISCLVRGVHGADDGLANVLALAALGVYLLFLVNVVSARP